MLDITNGREREVFASPKRVDWYDIARGGSILLVVLFHATIAWDAQFGVSRWFWEINNIFAPIRMPVFFCVSGLLARNLLARSWASIFHKRVALLWWLYGLWTAIFLITQYAVSLAALSQWAIEFIWPDEVLWFIWALSFYVIVARAVPPAARPIVLVLSFGLALTVSSGAVRISNIPHVKSLIYLPFYLAGAWCPELASAISKRPALAALLSMPLFVSIFLGLRWSLLPPIFLPVLACAGLALSISGSQLASNSRAITRAVGFLGQRTLPIYLCHTLFLDLLIFLVEANFTRLSPGTSLWAVPLIAFLAISLALSLEQGARKLGLTWLFELPRLKFASNGQHPSISSSLGNHVSGPVKLNPSNPQ